SHRGRGGDGGGSHCWRRQSRGGGRGQCRGRSRRWHRGGGKGGGGRHGGFGRRLGGGGGGVGPDHHGLRSVLEGTRPDRHRDHRQGEDSEHDQRRPQSEILAFQYSRPTGRGAACLHHPIGDTRGGGRVASAGVVEGSGGPVLGESPTQGDLVAESVVDHLSEFEGLL